ncbi:cytochrome P450 [Roseovarius rhodophyticola]|uniref:Cytochrome P450 n=1 Tax=Roseovarius rhodophyticola TaxID=3080827 RepID=A0ABZ2TE82_9RHOB|nr:cytochrome P450 [Roseovarius sp. W115]MDV2931161.1 cytochrome P450 [Roseovarius sp. W115]
MTDTIQTERETGASVASSLPIAAQLAERPVGLLKFAKLAGRNMLEVIPIETTTQTYLKGPLKIHYICDPEIITELLVGAGRRFPKAQFTKDILGSAVGNSMMLSEGEKWKAQRRRYSPLFAARNLPMLCQHFAETGKEIAASLREGPGFVDVAQMAPAATLTNISRVIFSGNEEVSAEQIRVGLRNYFEYISNISLFDVMGLPAWIPRKKWFYSKAPVTDMRALARQVIESRRSESRPIPLDFLDLMIAALEEDFEDIETTVDNLLTFVVAGHETSANAMAWGAYLLALHPEQQAAIHKEIINVSPKEPITYEDLEQMPLLRAHTKETLRLYPSAAFFARDAGDDITIKGIKFAKGDALFFPVYSLHRNRMLWDDPDAYKPERFLDKPPPRGQYIPFGDGPRVCIGAQYAEAEMMVLMASILRGVAFELGDAPIPRPVLTFTMRADGPIMLRTRAL